MALCFPSCDSAPDVWWQMDAIDSNGNEYILCWFDESIEEDDNGGVDVNLYKPDFIQCVFCVEE